MQRARRRVRDRHKELSDMRRKHAALFATGHEVVIYTDGSGMGSDGVGGWGVVCADPPITMSGRALHAGSYGAELEAMTQGMRLGLRLHDLGYGRPLLRVDNQACVRGITEWLPQWQVSGWRGHGGFVSQAGRWKRIMKILHENPGVFSFEWVKGHSGDPHNEAADKLAGMERNRAKGCSE